MIGWLLALWRQVQGRHEPDPWNHDPDIIEARRRQHENGITDDVLARRIEAEFWRNTRDRGQVGYP